MRLNRRSFYLMVVDALIFIAAFSFLSYFIQLSTRRGSLSTENAVLHCGVMILCVFVIRIVFGLYKQIWRYANVRDYLNLIIADFIGGCIYILIDRSVFKGTHLMGASAMAIICSSLIASLSARFVYQRMILFNRKKSLGVNVNRVNVAVVGAGVLGTALVQELQSNPKSRYVPYCFIDINPAKAGSMVCGLRVYGEQPDVAAQVRAMPVEEIIIAIDSLSTENLQVLYMRYRETGCKVKIYAHPLENTEASDGKHRIRDVRIEDLLYRETVSLGSSDLESCYYNKVILITGGGGSIGSELARQVAKLNPARLIILDIYENNANDIQQELQRLYGNKLHVEVEIASVRDAQKMEQVFIHYRPDIVFHAAAHKHVHLMEHCPEEAIKNNVFGTYHVADAAEKAGVERFILISTDKAVNPTNIMGASKRMCEMIIQSRLNSTTRFAAVRFGNVLGSNGSVIPLFKRQIEEGGPVTLTDRRIIRYFMTIPEASQLLLKTGAMAQNGEIFVLDMGKPVRILDLAENMIRLSGLVPHEDIEIKEIGLRPGEKLYEELLMKTEQLDKTENNKIFIEHDKPFTRDEIEEKLDTLRTGLLKMKDSSYLRTLMMRLLPTYHDADEVNNHALDAEEMTEAASALSVKSSAKS